MKNKNKFILAAVVATALSFGGCGEPADKASKNASIAADNFEVLRRITVINGITGEGVMWIEGYCSLQKSTTPGRIAFICKDDDDKFLKHFVDKGDNTIVLTEQLVPNKVSTYHTRIVLRPQAIIPDFDFQGDVDELINNSNTDG